MRKRNVDRMWRISPAAALALLLLPLVAIGVAPWGTRISSWPIYFYRWNSGAVVRVGGAGCQFNWEVWPMKYECLVGGDHAR